MKTLNPTTNRNNRRDPTRTTGIRRAFTREINKRFRRLTGLVRDAVTEKDVLGLKQGSTSAISQIDSGLNPRQFDFPRDEQKVNEFMAWLRRMHRQGILEVQIVNGDLVPLGDEPWTNRYIRSAYQKGIERARIEGSKVPEDFDMFRLGTDAAQIEAAFNQPFHADRVGMLYTRAFEDLQGVTQQMATQMRRILSQGIAEGRNPFDIARNLNRDVRNIGRNRARTIARTEVIRAHHQANIREMQTAGVKGVTVVAEWVTAGDDQVCELCQDLEAGTGDPPPKEIRDGVPVYDLDQVEGLLPRHPNCRCVVAPVPVN